MCAECAVCMYLSNTSLVHFIIVNIFFFFRKTFECLTFHLQLNRKFTNFTSLSAEWEYEFLRSFPFSVLPSKLQHEMRLHSYRTSDGTFFFRKQLKSNDYDCDFNGMKTKTVKWIFMFHRRKLICAVQHDFRLKCCKQTSSSFDLFFLFRYVWCTHAFASLLMYSTMS